MSAPQELAHTGTVCSPVTQFGAFSVAGIYLAPRVL